MSRTRVLSAALFVAFLLSINFWDEHFDTADFAIDIICLSLFIAIAYVAAVESRSKRLKNVGQTAWRDGETDSLFLSFRRLFAGHIRFFFPSKKGGCLRCFMPWVAADPHHTRAEHCLGQERGVFFALCEYCWRDLPAEARFKFYAMRYTQLVVRGATPIYIHTPTGEHINVDFNNLRYAVLSEEGDAPEDCKLIHPQQEKFNNERENETDNSEDFRRYA
jgi:hypothetical protein